MQWKRRRIVTISGGIIALLILAFGLNFILGYHYSSRLPEHPDFATVSKGVVDQIVSAERTTFWNPNSENMGKLGMVYHSATFYDQAAVCYGLAAEKDKKNPKWSYYLGYLNRQQSEFQKAIGNFSEVLMVDPDNLMALYYLGETWQSLNNVAEAEKFYGKVASISENAPEIDKSGRENYFPVRTYAMFNLARIFMTNNRQDEAIGLLKKIIKEQLKFGPAYRLLGNIYAQKGEAKLSNYYVTRAKDLAEFTPPSDQLMDQLVMLSRSELYLLKEIDIAVYNNNLQLALNLCNHAMQYMPDDKFLIYKSVRVFLATGKDKQALDLLDRHFSNFEQDYDEMMDIADRLYAKGYSPEAVRFFEQAKKLKPQNPYLPIWLSKYNMIEAAERLLKAQLEKEPNNAEMISNAVIIAMDRGDKEEAKSLLGKLKTIAPNYPEIRRYEGYFAEMEGNNSEVMEKWAEVIKAEPKDLRMINDLGVFYSKNKMFDKAKILYQQALENNPNVPFLLDELSKLLVFCPDEKLRNISESREYAERAFIGFTSDAKIRLSAATTLATAYAMSGDKQNAAKYITITLNLAGKENVQQDYLAYFDGLKKQYGL